MGLIDSSVKVLIETQSLIRSQQVWKWYKSLAQVYSAVILLYLFTYRYTGFPHTKLLFLRVLIASLYAWSSIALQYDCNELYQVKYWSCSLCHFQGWELSLYTESTSYPKSSWSDTTSPFMIYFTKCSQLYCSSLYFLLIPIWETTNLAISFVSFVSLSTSISSKWLTNGSNWLRNKQD